LPPLARKCIEGKVRKVSAVQNRTEMDQQQFYPVNADDQF